MSCQACIYGSRYQRCSFHLRNLATVQILIDLRLTRVCVHRKCGVTITGSRQTNFGLGLFPAQEMDVRLSHSGYWGPVTATLDWCEVWCSLLHSAYYLISSVQGKLSVLALRGRNFQHVLQSLLHLHISIRCTFVYKGISTIPLSRRICCSSSTCITAAPNTQELSFAVAGMCSSWAGQLPFPCDAPL